MPSIANQRFGKAQVFALALLAAYAAQCLWVASSAPFEPEEISYIHYWNSPERYSHPEHTPLIYAIAGNWDEIVPLSQQHRGFAFSSPRNNKGRTYVLAGRDDMTVAEVVKRLAAIRTRTADGLVLSVD